MSHTPTAWRVCCALAILLSILTFTPLVMPVSEPEPFLFGMPRTLWAGYLVSLGFFFLTLWGTYLMVQMNDKEDL